MSRIAQRRAVHGPATEHRLDRPESRAHRRPATWCSGRGCPVLNSTTVRPPSDAATRQSTAPRMQIPGCSGGRKKMGPRSGTLRRQQGNESGRAASTRYSSRPAARTCRRRRPNRHVRPASSGRGRSATTRRPRWPGQAPLQHPMNKRPASRVAVDARRQRATPARCRPTASRSPMPDREARRLNRIDARRAKGRLRVESAQAAGDSGRTAHRTHKPARGHSARSTERSLARPRRERGGQRRGQERGQTPRRAPARP